MQLQMLFIIQKDHPALCWQNGEMKITLICMGIYETEPVDHRGERVQRNNGSCL